MNHATAIIDSLADGERRGGIWIDGPPGDQLTTIRGQVERLGPNGRGGFRVLVSIGSRSIELNDVQSGTQLGAILERHHVLQAADAQLRMTTKKGGRPISPRARRGV
jgi:hypothetical protein